MSQVLKFFEGKVTKPTIIQWFNYFRNVITTYFVNHPVQFSPNCMVRVGGTFIGDGRKYGKRHIPKVKPRYLFGIVDRTDLKIYIQFIQILSLDIIAIILKMFGKI